MASENKKKKAKNSYLMNGQEAQKTHKLKRIAYYIKADRKANKDMCVICNEKQAAIFLNVVGRCRW